MQALLDLAGHWLGLSHLSDLFFDLPADLLAGILLLLGLLCGLAIKRVFVS